MHSGKEHANGFRGNADGCFIWNEEIRHRLGNMSMGTDFMFRVRMAGLLYKHDDRDRYDEGMDGAETGFCILSIHWDVIAWQYAAKPWYNERTG